MDLALDTLSWMGRLGRKDAIAALRRYVEVGWHWTWAVREMSYPTPVGLEDLDNVVSARSSSLDELAGELPWSGMRPWSDWRSTNPRIRDAFALRDEWLEKNEQRKRELSSLSTEELLVRREIRLLRYRTGPRDKAALHEAASNGPDKIRRDALKVLGFQRDPAVFDAAEAELRRYPDRDWPPNAGWFALSQLIRDGPIERIRGWIGEQGRPGKLALDMVATWPTEDDAPVLRAALEHLGDKEWLYLVCDAVDGLAKLNDREAVPRLEWIFLGTTHSYLRHKTARALALASHAFSESFALECLWDCEDQTRAVGCASATWSSNRARERISELAADRLEARHVRSVARRRVAAMRK